MFIVAYLLGVSTGRAESGLCPTRTRPDLHRWGRFQIATDPSAVPNQSGRVISDIGCESVGFGFSDFAGFWPKSSRISSDLVGSNEIWLMFLRIYGNMAEIWPS